MSAGDQLLFESVTSRVIMSLGPPSEVERFLTLFDDHGKELVRISMKTGRVTASVDYAADAMNTAARQFWRAVELMFPGATK